MFDYKKIPKEEYRSFSFKIKEKTGSGIIIAVLGVGIGGEDFFEGYLKEAFDYAGIIHSYSKIRQSDDRDEEGYRHSWLKDDINPIIKKAFVVDRTVEKGKSLLSADVYLLNQILEGNLNLEEIYNFTATDYADLGHFQASGKNIYGKRDGRSIFIEILGEKFPDKYEELIHENNRLKLEDKAFKDVFSRISDMPHMRLREEKEVKTEDRREFFRDISAAGLATLAGRTVTKRR